MPDYEMYFDEKNQNNYLKHIDYNTNNIKNIDYVPEQYKRKNRIVN